VRRILALAALAGLLAAAPLYAQMRGGGRGFASGGHFGFSRTSNFRPTTNFSHSTGFFGGVPGFHRGPFIPRPGFIGCPGCFHRNRFFLNASFGSFYYPYYYGYYPYSYSYPVAVQPPNYYPDEYNETGDLRRDIDVLTGKVDQLQQQLSERQPVPRPPARSYAPPEPQESTVLVFKDKRTREVQNYAIVGNTVWILNEQRAEKIPLSQLDLDATSKANEERGVGFQAPR
jgi:hypothetical protein